MSSLELASGLSIGEPESRLKAFCREEYAYYDGVPVGDPNRIEPVDILATVGINSRIDTAAKVRTVHLGMSQACDSVLPSIAEDANLASFEELDTLHALFAAAMKSRFVLLATATKVLHRKRAALIPVLDSVVVGHYLQGEEEQRLLRRSWENRTAAADAGHLTVERLKADLVGSLDELEGLRSRLSGEGYLLSHVRILDILVWSEVEPRGYYRTSTE